jgi:hypothetical protein
MGWEFCIDILTMPDQRVSTSFKNALNARVNVKLMGSEAMADSRVMVDGRKM